MWSIGVDRIVFVWMLMMVVDLFYFNDFLNSVWFFNCLKVYIEIRDFKS